MTLIKLEQLCYTSQQHTVCRPTSTNIWTTVKSLLWHMEGSLLLLWFHKSQSQLLFSRNFHKAVYWWVIMDFSHSWSRNSFPSLEPCHTVLPERETETERDQTVHNSSPTHCPITVIPQTKHSPTGHGASRTGWTYCTHSNTYKNMIPILWSRFCHQPSPHCTDIHNTDRAGMTCFRPPVVILLKGFMHSPPAVYIPSCYSK